MKSLPLLLFLPVIASAQTAVPAPLPQPHPPQAAAALRPAITPQIVPLNEEISDSQARLELARALFYLQKFDESLAEFEKVRAAKKDDPGIESEYAEVLFRAGRGPEAAAIFARLPAEKIPHAQKLAWAELLVAQGKFAEAADVYALCAKEKPEESFAQFRRAEVLSWIKRYDESLALYRELLAQHSDDLQLRRRFALTLLWAGKLEEAATEMRRTLPGM